MRNTIIGIILLVLPVLVYLYTWYLSITLFLIPSFKLFFSLYGVAGTFGIWIGLFLLGMISSFWFFSMLHQAKSRPQATYKETNS